MKISIYDPQPYKFPWLSNIYLNSIRSYREALGQPLTEIEDVNAVKNSVVIICSDYLAPDLIVRLKENHNFIVDFDINDNTDVTYTYRYADEMNLIDLIFSVSGVQKETHSFDSFVREDLSYTRVKTQFVTNKFYFPMVAEGRILPLPHVPYTCHDRVQVIPYENRRKKAIVRGGHHYFRVHLALNLLSRGLLDGNSGFPGKMYRHQYCDECKEAFRTQKKMTYAYINEHPDMPCRLKNWPHGLSKQVGHWNNSCLPRYFDLAAMYSKKYGLGGYGLDTIEEIFHTSFVAEPVWIGRVLNEAIVFADHKWVFSINIPPRFWEAAMAGTIAMFAERTNDQEYFPSMKDGEHYLTYKEDFSDLEKIGDITREQFDMITRNAGELYDKWIKPTSAARKISDNLTVHILTEIERAVDESSYFSVE